MRNPVKRFLQDEKGQGMTEYGLVLGGIAVVAVAVATIFGDTIKEKFSESAVTGWFEKKGE
ncbi:Flp family type IVb pilin [Bacillus tuaregi]|uniref:Flp family type IVb pilin n=1 Tax=Bacillus tuaregi TaxID=1816695 RepID=UPI0008F84914|nr:Flp family type IVb pilin [Bacillus tuaregi]